MTTVYVSIGNSDDKLSQQDWSRYCEAVDERCRIWAHETHGFWASLATAPYQNACWCIEINADIAPKLKESLRLEALRFSQDSIAWAEALTQFLRPPAVDLVAKP